MCKVQDKKLPGDSSSSSKVVEAAVYKSVVNTGSGKASVAQI